jgi:hypothetical protein
MLEYIKWIEIIFFWLVGRVNTPGVIYNDYFQQIPGNIPGLSVFEVVHSDYC